MSTVAGYNGVGVKEGMPRFLVAARDDDSMRVIEALKQLYRKKLRPTEEMFSFGSFHYDVITDTELDAKSQVLVIGQYSTGKTTFIRHLLGADFPNMNIGPEPTTDKFTVVMHGEQDLPVEGNSLALIKELPYEGLTRFGTGFLNKLDAAISTSPFLKNITLVDTPGVLSGEMQRRQRAYNFADVARWFADRSDMILILFDAHRLDVSDELMEILMRLVDHQYKIRIVLNKADQVDKATLRRVYGALMWSMGKVFDNPEVVRVYLGSFWEKPLKHRAHQKLFQADQNALTEELVDLPRLSAVRKVNQFIKRTKMVRAHACVLSYLCEQMPWMYGKLKRREELLNNLEGVLETVRVKHGLHEADMPEPEALRAKLHGFDFSEFPILTPAILRQLNNVVDVDVHKVLREGGGSAKFFKFSRNETPSARPGWISRAGMSMRDLFVGGSTTSSPPPAVASSRSSPAREHSSIPRAAVTPRPTTSSVTSAKQGGGMPSSVVESASGELDRSEEGSGMLSGAREKMASSTQRRGQERGRLQKKRTGWSYCGILQFLFVLCAGVILLLLALEPFMRSAGEGPLHSAAKAVRQKAERHLPQDTVRRLLSRGFGDWKGQQSGEPARDSSDEDESTSSDEVRALYKGMIH